MDALCSKILTYSDWSEEEQGRAIAGVLGLTPEKVSVLTRLPEAVLKTSLHNLRAQGKFQECHSCREHLKRSTWFPELVLHRQQLS